MTEPGNESWQEGQWPTSEIEAASLRSEIAGLLGSIPLAWAEFEFDSLTHLQARALFLLTAAGMVERRGWLRTRMVNHPIAFEIRFQATGEGGFAKAMEKAVEQEFETWKEAWNEWRRGDSGDRSPFFVQDMKPQEWRLTDQGQMARNELERASSEDVRREVLDFVLKCGLYGPGYWMRRLAGYGQQLGTDDQRIVDRAVAAGQDARRLSRPPVVGSGQLLEIRKIGQPEGVPSVSVANWKEGASVFSEVFAATLGPLFDAKNNAVVGGSSSDDAVPKSPTSTFPPSDTGGNKLPVPFIGGTMTFYEDRVELCGVDTCSGRRHQLRRGVLDLLRKTDLRGRFIGYSAEQLADHLQAEGGPGTVAGAIRDLRARISKALLEEANIQCGPSDVICSGGPGYRFAECITVHDGGNAAAPAITDTITRDNVPDGRDADVPNVPDDVPNVPGESALRRAWIVERLKEGHRLKRADVVEEFACSDKTAQRELTALKDAGTIEFVGTTRNGYYRLRSQGPRETK